MNTKGTKFLAVLAVFVMVFAALAVIAPSDATSENSDKIITMDKVTYSLEKIEGLTYKDGAVSGLAKSMTKAQALSMAGSEDHVWEYLPYALANVYVTPETSDVYKVGNYVKVVQTNSALAINTDPHISDGVKTKVYSIVQNATTSDQLKADGDNFNFMIPTDGSKVTFKLTYYDKDPTAEGSTAKQLGEVSFSIDYAKTLTVYGEGLNVTGLYNQIGGPLTYKDTNKQLGNDLKITQSKPSKGYEAEYTIAGTLQYNDSPAVIGGLYDRALGTSDVMHYAMVYQLKGLTAEESYYFITAPEGYGYWNSTEGKANLPVIHNKVTEGNDDQETFIMYFDSAATYGKSFDMYLMGKDINSAPSAHSDYVAKIKVNLDLKYSEAPTAEKDVADEDVVIKDKSTWIKPGNEADKNTAVIAVTSSDVEAIIDARNVAVSYTLQDAEKDPTNVVVLKGVQGLITVTKGSIEIDAKDIKGEFTVSGNVVITGSFGGNAEIKAAAGLSAAPIVTFKGVTVNSGVKLTLTGLSISATADIKNNGTIILGEKTTFASQVKIDNVVDTAKVTGQVSGSNLTLVASGETKTITPGAALTVNGRLTIPAGTTLYMGSYDFVVNEGATLYMYGTLDGTKVVNNGTIVLLDAKASIPAAISGTGTIDTSAISSDAILSGKVETVSPFSKSQTVRVIADTEMIEGSMVIINGTMVIEEGVTLTISDGAMLAVLNSYGKLVNNGTIIVQSAVVGTDKTVDGTTFDSVVKGSTSGLYISNATIDNNGTIELSYSTNGDAEPSMTLVNNAIFNNNYYFDVKEGNILTVDTGAINNSEDGTILFSGEATGFSVSNAGLFTMDGKATTGITVKATAVDASVIITKLIGKLTVNNDGMKHTPAYSNGNASIAFDSTTYELAGLAVVAKETSSKTSTSTSYYKNLEISGEGIVSGTGSPAATIAITQPSSTSSYVKVTDNLNLADEITLTGDLRVTGKMVLEDGSKYASGNMYVTGMVEAGKNKVAASPNAAMYVVGTTTKTYYYTTLDKAITGASEASVKDIEAMGAVSVSDSIEIPSGMTVKQTSGKITVGSASKNTVVLTVADGAKIDQKSGANIDVKGTLYVANKNTGINKTADITSEVKAEGTTDVRYTNFLVAVGASYTEPTTVILSGDVVIDSDLVIPEMVTVDANGQNFTIKGAKLTIDGTLFLNGANYTAEDVVLPNGTVVKPEVIANGYMKSADAMAYSESDPRFPAGAYYTITDSGVYNMITGIANSPNVIADANENTIVINGKDLAFGSIIYLGTKSTPAYVNIMGSVASGSIAIDNTVLTIENGLEVNAEVVGPIGSVDMNAAKTTARTVFNSVEDSDGDVFEITSGGIGAKADDKEGYSLVFDDAVGITNLTVVDATIDGVVLAGIGISLNGKTTVNGILVVDNGVTMQAEDVYVLGSFMTKDATSSSATGRATLSGTLTVGEDNIKTSAAASVYGAITAPYYFIFAGSDVDGTISESILGLIELKQYTDFYVEDSLWLSVYYTTSADDLKKIAVKEGSSVEYNYQPADLTDSVFSTWQAEDDEGKLVTIKETTKVGQVNEVYASINYYIYNVTIVSDNGIKAISIDNVLMTNTTGGNTFTMNALKAGVHTVSYSLYNGYEGEAQLLTADGTLLQGLKFTLSGTPESGDVMNNTYQLTGTHQIVVPEPEPVTPEEKSEWTITTILLVILVILIAIMAVLVALKLNRS